MTNLHLSLSGSLFQQALIQGDYSPHFFAYYYKQWNNYSMSYHQHNSTEIMYLISGSCVVDVHPRMGEEERFRLKRGELIILDANVPHRLIVEDGSPCRMLNVEFGFMEYTGVAPSIGKLALQEKALAEWLQVPFSSLVMLDPEEIYHVLKGLVLELDQSGGNGGSMVDLLFCELLLRLSSLRQDQLHARLVTLSSAPLLQWTGTINSLESNGHLSEYVPWYRKRSDEIMDWIDLGSWINGETGGYLRVCTEGRNWFETDFPNWMKDSALEYTVRNRGEEHGSFIIEGLETGRVYRGHFNTVNNGVISNLPDDAIIEAPGYVDRNGISMPLVGELPLGPAAVCNVSISVQRLAVEAAVHGDDKLLRQAFMMDPLVGAVCNPKEIWQMVDEMLVAGEQWLPQYSEAIAKAKERLATGDLISTNANNEGAARLKVKTVDEMMQDRDAANKNAGESDKGKDREKVH